MGSKKAEAKKSYFKGRVAKNAKEQKTSKFGYLKMPSSVPEFKPKPETTVSFNIIPYIISDPKHPDRNDDDDVALPEYQWWRRPFKTHVHVGSDDMTVICPTTFGDRCPICEIARKKQKAGADKEELKDYWAKSRYLYIIVPVKNKDYPESLHYLNMSQKCFQDKLTEELQADQDNEVFPDLEDGLTLEVRFKGSRMPGGKDAFPEASRIDFRERKEAYDEAILDLVPDLDRVFKVLSYDELLEKLAETEDDVDEEDVDDDDEPRGKSESKPLPLKKAPKPVEDDEDIEPPKKAAVAKKAAKPAPAPEPEEEEEDEEEDEEEEVEEVKSEPKKRTTSPKAGLTPVSSKTKPTPPVEEEEEEEDEEEQDDEENEDEEEELTTWDELSQMKFTALKKFVREHPELKKIHPDDMEDDLIALRTVIAKAMSIAIPKVKTSPSPKKEEKCIACGGTGKNSRGKTCPICEGSGIKPAEEERKRR